MNNKQPKKSPIPLAKLPLHCWIVAEFHCPKTDKWVSRFALPAQGDRAFTVEETIHRSRHRTRMMAYIRIDELLNQPEVSA